jgi:hypothetical protein
MYHFDCIFNIKDKIKHRGAYENPFLRFNKKLKSMFVFKIKMR